MKQRNQLGTHSSPASKLYGRRGGRSGSGHTLVELLAVVTILLVLMAIALPRLMAARQSAQQASAVVFLRSLHVAQEQFYFAHGSYAATFAELNGFLASNAGGPVPLRQHAVRLSPLPHSSMPMLAFLLLPAAGMPDEPIFTTDGPKRPTGKEEHSGGGAAPSGDSPGAGNTNPAGGSKNGSGPGPDGGANGGGGSQGSSGSGPGGSSSGSGGGAQGGAWSNADRMTYQGYEFYLLRPTAHNWNCLAMPVRDERNGNHYFTDQTGTIRRQFGQPASAQSPIL